MALEIQIKLDKKDLQKAFRKLGKVEGKIAINQAINKTLTGIRTDATKFLTKKTRSKKQATIRKKFVLKKSLRSTLYAELITPPLDLALSNQKGVRVIGKGKKQRVKWRNKYVKAFRIKGSVGALKDDIFIRVEGRKSPVRAFSYTLLQEYKKHDAANHLRLRANRRFQKEYDRALSFRLKKLGFK